MSAEHNEQRRTVGAERECWRAGDLLIDVGRQRVERGGVEIALAPLSFSLFLELVRAAPNVLSNDQLMEAVWPGLVVSPDTVSQRVKLLREALGDSAKVPHYVRGLRGRGYVLTVDATRVAADSQPIPGAVPAAPGSPITAELATPEQVTAPRSRRWLPWLVTAAIAAAAVGAFLGFRGPDSVINRADVRLAVLPFTSDAASDAYLASGITNDLIERLTQAPGMRVVVGWDQGAMQSNLSAAEIGKRRNATHLLQGRLQRVDGTLRIHLQLVRAADATVLLAKNFSRAPDALILLRDDLASALLRQLDLSLPAGARSEVPSEAHRLFLRADFLTQRTSREGFAEALDLYDQAIALAPDYAAAWEGKARIYQFQAALGRIPLVEGYARAREMATKALAVDEGFALAHTRLGAIDLLEGDLTSAARHIQRGLDLAPNNQLTQGNASVLLRSLGRLREAKRLSDAADDVNTLNPRGNLSGGELLLAMGDTAAAARHFRATLSLQPGFQSAGYYLGVALLRSNDPGAARAAIMQEDSPWYRQRGLVLLEQRLGNNAAADMALTELRNLFVAGQGSAYGLATACAARGKADEAFLWLERATKAKYDYELTQLVVDPLLSPLHTDPRWPQLLARLGRSPAQLDAIAFDSGESRR